MDVGIEAILVVSVPFAIWPAILALIGPLIRWRDEDCGHAYQHVANVTAVVYYSILAVATVVSFVSRNGALFWIVVLVGPVVGVGVAIRLRTAIVRSKRDPGACERCGYDLRGNVSGVCPECGLGSEREHELEESDG
jgi:hypothetical protein